MEACESCRKGFLHNANMGPEAPCGTKARGNTSQWGKPLSPDSWWDLPTKYKWTVQKQSFGDLEKYGERMRDCDMHSLKALRPYIDEMRRNGVSYNKLSSAFIAEEGNENAKKLVRLVECLEPLTRLARSPWKPLMWNEAEFLRDYDTMISVLKPDNQRKISKGLSDRSQSKGLSNLMTWCGGKPTDDNIQTATQAAYSLWIPIEHLCNGLVPG